MLLTQLAYSICAFCASFLLFIIQPMAGKFILPVFGGAPAAWTTCMLCFQALLLAGYIYAEKSIKRLGWLKQSISHLVLLFFSSFLLPISFNLSNVGTVSETPTLWLTASLFSSIGLFFFLLASNAPMIQSWYSFTKQKDSSDPYFLYSASNAGSLLALLSYPFLVEPHYGLTEQKELWSLIYYINIFLVLICFALLLKHSDTKQQIIVKHATKAKVSAKQKFLWCFYGLIPCSAMLGVTTHITTDISSNPLLWVVPLSVYLISFVLVFAKTSFFRKIRWERTAFPAGVVILMIYFLKLNNPIWFSYVLHLSGLFIICMYFHSALANSRPDTSALNCFFVYMSLGGILAGILNAIAAPLIFNTQIEYALTIIISSLYISFFESEKVDKTIRAIHKSLIIIFSISCFAYFIVSSSSNASILTSHRGMVALGIVMLTLQLFYKSKPYAGITCLILVLQLYFCFSIDNSVIFAKRSFFGILRISSYKADLAKLAPKSGLSGIATVFHNLFHGNTLHGSERRVKTRAFFPLSYYSRESPVGLVFRAGLVKRQFKNIGIVGLGCGTLAWYGRFWQNLDFYEIDPLVCQIAQNNNYFSYLSNCKAKWNIIEGDARISLSKKPDKYYDLLVLDAYSSDSIPTHLLTIEAVKLYLQKLKPGGIMLFHLSNRYFDLTPVLSKISDELDLYCMGKHSYSYDYEIKYDDYELTNICSSQWLMLSDSFKMMELINRLGKWEFLPYPHKHRLWTDDYVNIWQVYKQ